MKGMSRYGQSNTMKDGLEKMHPAIQPKPVIHYLSDLVCNEEYAAMHHYFCCTNRMMRIQDIGGADPLVIPRYTVQPQTVKDYIPDLNDNFKTTTSVKEYAWVSDIRNWYHDLEDLTPKTWFSHQFQYLPKDGKYVVRGTKTSRKDHWEEMMYAEGKPGAIKVLGTLYQDGLVGAEDCVVRNFIPFVKYGNGIGGIPIIREFRIFVFNSTPFYTYYYWTNYPDLIPKQDKNICNLYSAEMGQVINQAIDIASQHCLFYSLDIAQDIHGKWWVVEVNDGHRSGVPVDTACDYMLFYENFRREVDNWIREGCPKP